MTNYGDRYHLNCVDGETLVADVLEVCVDGYLGSPTSSSKGEIIPTIEKNEENMQDANASERPTMQDTQFTTPDTCASSLQAETTKLAKSPSEKVPLEDLLSAGVAGTIGDVVNESLHNSDPPLPVEVAATIRNAVSDPVPESKKPAVQIKLRPCPVHWFNGCTCCHDDFKGMRICPLQWLRRCTCCKEERIYKSVVARAPAPLTAMELKKELLKLAKENPKAWKELDAEYGGGEKRGVSVGYHFAKLESCVPPLRIGNRGEKAGEKSKNKGIMTFGAYVASEADEEKKADKGTQHLTNEQWAIMLTERPLKWKVCEDTKGNRATKSASVASLKPQVATKAIKSFQPSPTKQFERMLSEHVNAPVTTKAPPVGKVYADQETSRRQATSSVPPHLLLATCSKTPPPELGTDSEDIWESDDEKAYLSDSTMSTPQTSRADTPRQPTSAAAPRPKRPREATFLCAGYDASGNIIDLPISVKMPVTIFIISSLILMIQNIDQIFDSIAPVFSYIYPA